MADRCIRKSRCVFDVVSIGTPPPKRKQLHPGRAFEIGLVEEKVKDMKQHHHGITNVHAAAESDPSGYVPDARMMTWLSGMIKDMKKALIQEVKDEVASTSKKGIQKLLAETSMQVSLDVLVRRLLQAWLKTHEGKSANQRATKALKCAYDARALSGSEDFISEAKHVLKIMDHRQLYKHEQVELKLTVLNDIISQHFTPAGLGSAGFLELLNSYRAANASVHKGFSKEELEDIRSESASFWSSDAGGFITHFTTDLLKYTT